MTDPLLTPTRIRQLLSTHGLAPNKRLGQNFVTDANTVRKLVADARIMPGDRVVEIGPGLGSLTLALRAAGANVVAIEIDRGLIRALRDVVDDDVRIIHADALTVEYSALVGKSSRLMGNLPYNVATPLLMTALESGMFRDVHVMVQREVGERWCARPGQDHFGAVSVKIEAMSTARLLGAVSRRAFWPVPRVDSVTVGLDVHDEARDHTALFALIDAGFSQRRKRLRNSLTTGGWTVEEIDAGLVSAQISKGVRAEELALPDWQRLRASIPIRR